MLDLDFWRLFLLLTRRLRRSSLSMFLTAAGLICICWLLAGTSLARQTGSFAERETGYRRFVITSGTASEVEAFLQSKMPVASQYQIFVSPEIKRELVVVGDADALQLCSRLIQEFEMAGATRSNSPATEARFTASPAAEPPANSARLLPAANEGTGWLQVGLQRTDLRFMQAALTGLFDGRLSSKPTRNGILNEVTLADQSTIRFGWDWETPVINLSGNADQITQFGDLIRQLDDTADADSKPSVVAYRNASTAAVHRLFDVYDTGASTANAGYQLPGSSIPSVNEFAPSLGSGSTQEPVPGANSALPQTLSNPITDDFKPTEKLRQIQDSIQIETLPELGVIILRGRQKEVQELSRIIQELERLSAETQPEYQIVLLEHSRSESIEKILQNTSADLISGRSGRVTVTSLGKPNALLLIGWGEAIVAITDLIHKLDQPVAPNTQFDVYRLTNADAESLQLALDGFFKNRDGLGTNVQVITDDRSNSVVAFGAPRDLAEVRRLVSELDVPNFRKKQQARVIKIQYAVAAELAVTLQSAITGAQGTGKQKTAFLELLGGGTEGQNVLESGVLDEVQITANPSNNSLIVTGPAESIDLLEGLIRQLDVIGSTAQIKVFRIQQGDASTLVQMLRSLMPEQTTERPALKMANDLQESSLAPLRFSVDTRTNSIIATGSEGDLRIIHALLLRLDEKEFSERKNLVYRLKNAPATDVALAINNFLRSERQVQLSGTTSVSPFEQLEREVIVVPEPIGNRLILSATPRFFGEIEALIKQLDEPPPQVMIQVMIAEVLLDNSREFGIELGLQDSVLFDRSLLGNLVTTTATTQTSTPGGVVTSTEQIVQAAGNEPGFNFNNAPLGNSGSNLSRGRSNVVGSQGLSNFSVGRINNELGFGGLVLSASSESVSALLRALQECRRMEILSRPQIRTLDNQPAFIQVGQRVPRIIGSTVNQNGQSNSIALENVGLILGVTPRISPDGTVVMEIDAERSGLGPESEGIPVSVAPNGSIIRSPRVDTTTAQATVSAASGETIILGGLITKKTTTIDRKVPLLGDIPLLGSLFRYDGDFTRRAELLIILTPYVIRDHGDEQRLQQMEYARMNWCLSEVESLHGALDGTFNPVNLDYDSPLTEEIYPGQSPTIPAQSPALDGDSAQPIPSRSSYFAPPESVPAELNSSPNR